MRLLLKYSQIEAALADMHCVPQAKMGAFRARMRNYQKIGVVPTSGGKGQKILYTLRDASIWAFCFELEEVGYSPETCKKVLENLSDIIIPFFIDEHIEHKDGMYLVLIGLFLQWRLNDNTAQGFAHVSGIYSMEEIIKRKFIGTMQRVVLIQITSVREKLIKALADVLI